MSTETAEPIDRVIFREEVARLFNIQSDTVGKWIRERRLPKPDVAVSRKRQGWNASTLRALGFNVP